MKTKYLVAVLGVAAAGFALPAAAQMKMPNLSSAYVGGSLGQSKLKFNCAGASPCDDKDTAFRIFGGYQVNQTFSAELGYADLGSAKIGGASLDGTAWDLSAIGAWPVANQFSIFGRLGLYHGEVKAPGGKGTKNSLTYGLGAQYDFNRNLGIRAEWQRYNKMGGGDLGQTANVDVLGIGALWRFQ
jgi:OOP family OmpA-OmpF porin